MLENDMLRVACWSWLSGTTHDLKRLDLFCLFPNKYLAWSGGQLEQLRKS